MDNMDAFKKNGFTFEINENAQPTKRVKLLTLPMSKNWIFGKDDIEELLFMLRVSKIRSLYNVSLYTHVINCYSFACCLYVRLSTRFFVTDYFTNQNNECSNKLRL